MAPTTLVGQVSTTTPFGRKPELHGYPVRVSEMLSTLEGAVYIERVSVDTVKNIKKAKAAIKKLSKYSLKVRDLHLLKYSPLVPQTGV